MNDSEALRGRWGEFAGGVVWGERAG